MRKVIRCGVKYANKSYYTIIATHKELCWPDTDTVFHLLSHVIYMYIEISIRFTLSTNYYNNGILAATVTSTQICWFEHLPHLRHLHKWKDCWGNYWSDLIHINIFFIATVWLSILLHFSRQKLFENVYINGDNNILMKFKDTSSLIITYKNHLYFQCFGTHVPCKLLLLNNQLSYNCK